MVGANDVTHRLSPAAQPCASWPRRSATCARSAAEVVVGTCPDLGTIKPVRPAAALLARRGAGELAAAQTVAVVEAGGRTVSLG